MDQGIGKEIAREITSGVRRYIGGKWYCDCNHPAKCITVTKDGPNKGRKFWTCPKAKEEQCTFFLWVEHEAAEKERLGISRLPLMPQTPTKTSSEIDEPKPLETPFTKAKRKVPPRDSLDYSNNNNQKLDVVNGSLQSPPGLDDPFEYSHEPSGHTGKAARTSTILTPSQSFVERLRSNALPSPTPNSGDHMPTSNRMIPQQLLQPLDMSPTPGRFHDRADLNAQGNPDLAATILDLIRADNLKLKPSTEVLIRHEIRLILDMSEAKLHVYERTNSELRKRIDELETIVLHLT